MKVKCLFNSGNKLPSDCRGGGYDENTEYKLIVGKEYIVYGFTVFLGYIWYYLCNEIYDDVTIKYPLWQPAPLFEVIDGRLSKYWEFGFERGDSVRETFQVVTFREWISEPAFYDRLTNGEEREVDIFRRYKKLLDNEFE